MIFFDFDFDFDFNIYFSIKLEKNLEIIFQSLSILPCSPFLLMRQVGYVSGQTSNLRFTGEIYQEHGKARGA
ncbi:hypothetical protein MmTuc01_1227 [Methanosarcina mazei Tuc01]|uniref:Uncharacterized protein n=1 Tax=Methanosarcina mazei Tuc01 TaxID=1236903 RepID=M1QI25_METMZ|nr:hypothetical protein MmTuc01_1227 [Methanosarcina mazei Tuc01]